MNNNEEKFSALQIVSIIISAIMTYIMLVWFCTETVYTISKSFVSEDAALWIKHIFCAWFVYRSLKGIRRGIREDREERENERREYRLNAIRKEKERISAEKEYKEHKERAAASIEAYIRATTLSNSSNKITMSKRKVG